MKRLTIWFAIGFLLGFFAIVVAAFADGPVKPKAKIFPMPVVCSDMKDFRGEKEKEGFFVVWEGLTGNKAATTLFINSNHEWLIVVQVAGNPLTCIVAFGDQEEFASDEASNE